MISAIAEPPAAAVEVVLVAEAAASAAAVDGEEVDDENPALRHFGFGYNAFSRIASFSTDEPSAWKGCVGRPGGPEEGSRRPARVRGRSRRCPVRFPVAPRRRRRNQASGTPSGVRRSTVFEHRWRRRPGRLATGYLPASLRDPRTHVDAEMVLRSGFTGREQF